MLHGKVPTTYRQGNAPGLFGAKSACDKRQSFPLECRAYTGFQPSLQDKGGPVG